jgi:hypothetical protein
MKNSYSIKSKTNNQAYGPFKVIIALLTIILFFNSTPVSAQQKHVGLNLSTSCSGSGLGIFYSPSVYFQKNRALFSVGAVINANSPRSIGLQSGFDYSLKEQKKLNLKNIYSYEEYNSRAEMFLFTTFLYRPDGRFSNSTIAAEAGKAPEHNQDRAVVPQEDLRNIRFSTYEGYIGFGLKIRICDRIKWAGRIGGGAYYSPDAPKDMFRTQAGVSLLVRTGFYIDLF